MPTFPLSQIWKRKKPSKPGEDEAGSPLAPLSDAHVAAECQREQPLSNAPITSQEKSKETAGPLLPFTSQNPSPEKHGGEKSPYGPMTDEPKDVEIRPSPLQAKYCIQYEPNEEEELQYAVIPSEPDGSQPSPTSPAFTLFTNLPTEIRLQIYRSMFPGPQHVCFDFDFPWTSNYESSIQSQNRLPLPPSLFINQESRAETLKHYYVLFKHDSPAFQGFAAFHERPVVFDPTRDSAYITFGSLHGGTNYRRFDVWINYINMQMPGCRNQIQSLEIRDMNWEIPISAWIQGESPMPSLNRWNKAGGLQWFHGLKTLCLTGCRDRDNGLRYRGNQNVWRPGAPASVRFEEKKRELEEWFVKRQEKGEVDEVPRVTVRRFTKVKWSALCME